MLKQLKEVALEVIVAMLPVSLAVAVLQLMVTGISLAQFFQFIIGVGMCIIGMILFLVGVKTGLLPMGEAIGSELPERGSLLLLIATAFLIGFAVTVAEPDVIVLTGQIDEVSRSSISENILINVIAIGIGFFVAVAMLRIAFGFPMKYLFASGYATVLILSFFVPPEFVPVAFDAGGVTTGPMTVPVILSLGIGLSSVLAGRSTLTDGFGLIGLASIGPIIGVMIMGIILQ